MSWLYDPHKKSFLQPASEREVEEFKTRGYVEYFPCLGAKAIHVEVCERPNPLKTALERHGRMIAPLEGWEAVREVTGNTRDPLDK